MGKQYNKLIKRRRRAAYLDRKKATSVKPIKPVRPKAAPPAAKKKEKAVPLAAAPAPAET